MKWYYIDESITDGDRRLGPFSIEEIQDLVREGKISETTLVWHNGEESWKPWKAYSEEMQACEIDQNKILQDTINEILKEQVLTKWYAGFFVRGTAFIIDNLILAIAGAVILTIMNVAHLLDISTLSDLMNAYIADPTSDKAIKNILEAQGMGIFLVIWSILQAAYFTFFHAIYAATPGKMLMHIHVEMASGNRINWGFSLLRYVASIITQTTLMFYGLGYLIVFIDPKRRTIHDFIANTRVIYNTPKKIIISEK